MPRKVFFSFHYDDVHRVNVVRHSDTITRKYTGNSRFTDRSLWETAKSQGPTAIKRLINPQLEYTSVTCVLIGQETWRRPWVRYELLKSLARGNGIFGVRIHDVGFAPRKVTLGNATTNPFSGLQGYQPASSPFSGLADLPAPPGRNPLEYVGYTVDRASSRITFHERDNGDWWISNHVESVPFSGLGHLLHFDTANLSSLFPVYDWKADNGYLYIDDWIEEAARRAGKP